MFILNILNFRCKSTCIYSIIKRNSIIFRLKRVFFMATPIKNGLFTSYYVVQPHL